MNLKALMDQAFKFSIGQTVIPKQHFDALKLSAELNPVKGYADINILTGDTVIGRWLEECHGGIQLHYRVRRYRGAADGGGEVTFTFSELELVAYSEMEEWLRQAARERDAKKAEEEAKWDPKRPPMPGTTRWEVAQLKQTVETVMSLLGGAKNPNMLDAKTDVEKKG